MNGPTEFDVIGSLRDWDRTADIHRIASPTLVTVGRHDELTPGLLRDPARRDRRRPHVVFEESAHCAHLEEPELYAQVVDEFLREVDGGQRRGRSPTGPRLRTELRQDRRHPPAEATFCFARAAAAPSRRHASASSRRPAASRTSARSPRASAGRRAGPSHPLARLPVAHPPGRPRRALARRELTARGMALYEPLHVARRRYGFDSATTPPPRPAVRASRTCARSTITCEEPAVTDLDRHPLGLRTGPSAASGSPASISTWAANSPIHIVAARRPALPGVLARAPSLPARGRTAPPSPRAPRGTRQLAARWGPNSSSSEMHASIASGTVVGPATNGQTMYWSPATSSKPLPARCAASTTCRACSRLSSERPFIHLSSHTSTRRGPDPGRRRPRGMRSPPVRPQRSTRLRPLTRAKVEVKPVAFHLGLQADESQIEPIRQLDRAFGDLGCPLYRPPSKSA